MAQLWILKAERSGLLDAHGYGKRFIVHAEEMMPAFLELERAIHQFAVDLVS